MEISNGIGSSYCTIKLLGKLEIVGQSGQVLSVTSPTLRLLIAYLAIHHENKITRKELATAIWPRLPISVARRNLRQYLYRARHKLSESSDDPNAELLIIDGRSVQLNTVSGAVQLDIQQFEAVVNNPSSTVEQLAQAINMYRNELLADLDAIWITAKREQVRGNLTKLLERVLDQHETDIDEQTALEYARKLVDTNPYLDTAYSRLMKLLYRYGLHTQAIKVYQAYEERLLDELDTQPMSELTNLYHAIRQGTLGAATPKPHRVTGIKAPPIPDETLDGDYIGRETELEQLVGILSVPQRHGDYIFVRGPAGIGKTRLVREVLRNIPSRFLMLQAQSYEFDVSALQPILDAIRVNLQRIDWYALLPDPQLVYLLNWFPELHTYFPRSGPQQFSSDVSDESGLIWNTLIYLFYRLGQSQPVLLVLDDMQWSSPKILQLLLTLRRWVESSPIFILLSYQPGEGNLAQDNVAMRRLERLSDYVFDLQPLLPHHSSQLAQQILGPVSLDQIHMKRLINETEGNPLFVMEYSRVLRERYPLKENLWIDVPGNIQNLIDERLDRLPSVEQHIMWAASVIRRPFPLEMLIAIENDLSTSDIVDGLESCLKRRLLIEQDGYYSTSHNVIRQVSYKRLTRARSALIHRKVADAYSNGTANMQVDDNELAYHYEQSDQPEKAVVHVINACRQALRLRDYDSAQRMGMRAIQQMGHIYSHSSSTSKRIDLELQLALAYSYTREFAQAKVLLESIETLARGLNDNVRLAEICRALAHVHWQLGKPEHAKRYAQNALNIVEDNFNIMQSSIRMLGRTSIALGEYDDAIVHLLRYLKNSPSEELVQRAIVYGYLGVAYARIGSWSKAIETAEEGVELAEKTQNEAAIQTALMQLVFVHSEYRQWQVCLDIAHNIELIEGSELSSATFMLVATIGRAFVHTGQIQKGIDYLQWALDWAKQADYRIFAHVPMLWLAEAELLRGNVLESLSISRQTLRVLSSVKDSWGNAIGLILAAKAIWQTKNPNWPQIEANLVQGAILLRQIRARPDLARTYLLQRRLYDRAGRSAWAIDCHLRAVQLFEELNMQDELREAQGHPEVTSTTPSISRHVELVGPHGLYSSNWDDFDLK